MRHTLRTLGLLISLVVPGAATAASGTSLRVELRDGGGMKTWTVQCDPVAGSLPGAAEACARLAQVPDPTVQSTERPLCVQGFPAWLSGLRISGTIKGVSVDELKARDFQCWQSMAFASLASVLGVSPETLAASTPSDRQSRRDRRRGHRDTETEPTPTPVVPTAAEPARSATGRMCPAKRSDGKREGRRRGSGSSRHADRD